MRVLESQLEKKSRALSDFQNAGREKKTQESRKKKNEERGGGKNT